MSASQGVPEIPASLRDTGDPEMAAFVDIWQWVQMQEKSEGLRPYSGPHTVLAVSKSSMRLAVPCDLPNPFSVDSEFQRKLLRRHVLTERVPPTDDRFSSGGRAGRLDGGEVILSREKREPAFAIEDRPPAPASHMSGTDEGVVVYQVHFPLVSFDEVMEAVRRHKPRPWYPRSLTEIVAEAELKQKPDPVPDQPQ